MDLFIIFHKTPIKVKKINSLKHVLVLPTASNSLVLVERNGFYITSTWSMINPVASELYHTTHLSHSANLYPWSHGCGIYVPLRVCPQFLSPNRVIIVTASLPCSMPNGNSISPLYNQERKEKIKMSEKDSWKGFLNKEIFPLLSIQTTYILLWVRRCSLSIIASYRVHVRP